MSVAFKNKYVRVEVDDTLISVVELTGLELIKNGKVEAKYGRIGSHSARRHSVGSSFARFSIRRWFKTGSGQPLFYSLHENHAFFTIRQYLNQLGLEGEYRGIKLNNCQIYRYRLVTGSVNDIVAEEIIGEATSWEGVLTYDQVCMLFLVSAGTSQLIFDVWGTPIYVDSGESVCCPPYEIGTEYRLDVYLAPYFAFDYWEVSGDIEVGDIYDSNTWIKINGAGTLTLHVYYYGC